MNTKDKLKELCDLQDRIIEAYNEGLVGINPGNIHVGIKFFKEISKNCKVEALQGGEYIHLSTIIYERKFIAVI